MGCGLVAEYDTRVVFWRTSTALRKAKCDGRLGRPRMFYPTANEANLHWKIID